MVFQVFLLGPLDSVLSSVGRLLNATQVNVFAMKISMHMMFNAYLNAYDVQRSMMFNARNSTKLIHHA